MRADGTIPSGGAGAPRRGARTRVVLALVLVLVASLWLGRRPLLVAMGRALVVEDPLAPVDLLIVSNAAARADALEAARLYRDGISRRLAVSDWVVDSVTAEVRCLGIPLLDPTSLSRAILERSGVPSSAIAVMPGQAEGTEDEIAATVEYVRGNAEVRSLLFLAPRTHTARVRWLLRRRLPPAVGVAVRSASYDPFYADDWWRSRDASREVMAEYLRWVNTAILGDAWGTRPPGSGVAPVTCSCCPGGQASAD
jgi:uncharacterized SAM-binding protein YcdF (DUF218 family)